MIVQPPSYSIKEGTYTAAITVAFNKPNANDITVYYTTDGNQPDTDSTVYRAPITIDTTTTLKSIAVNKSGEKSEVETAVYTIAPEAGTYTPHKPDPGTTETVDVYDQFMGAITGMWSTRFPDDSIGVYSFYPIDSMTGYMTYTEIGPEGYGDAYSANYRIDPDSEGYDGYIYLTDVESGGLKPRNTTLFMEVNPYDIRQGYIEGFFFSYDEVYKYPETGTYNFMNNIY